MRVRLGTVLLAFSFCGIADDGATVNSVVAAVRASIARKSKDAGTARSLDKMKLAQHLEDRVIEILESEGAGLQTLGALQRMRDASRLLPAPPGPPPGMTPPPPPSFAEEHRVWQATGVKALDYTRSLPDFICSETVHRWIDPAGNEEWQPAPTLIADLTFFDRQEHYKLLTVDGKKSEQSLPDVAGATSQGEFGSMLATIFHPASETDFRWDHWTTLRKRSTYVYFFRITAAHRPYKLRFGTGANAATAPAGLHGYVYIDRETDSVTRISAHAEDIPAGFPVQESSTVLDYDYADVGGKRFLLPLRAEVRIDSRNVKNLNSVEFQKYRKFSAEGSVSFGEGKQ
jgi:hypothetical protein